ncbi:MAG: UDP-3-O-(3-hydroxymyristoyl)glucosamine N-acyltransferase [Phycisphaerales bacterium]|nr:UDP-3-O-(3-hydroxymyristoyl)glucosamine N-acyltransferase [Phycisphaerales bacterium]
MQLTAQEIAVRTGGTLEGPGTIAICGVNDLRGASASDATFISDTRYAQLWKDSRASVALVSHGIQVPGHDATTRALIRVDKADIAMIKLLEIFAPEAQRPSPGVHASAVVESQLAAPEEIFVGPFVWIGANCRIGRNVVIHAGARIYGGVSIGDDTTIHANAVIRENCVIGSRVILHAGAVIGTEGFGYRPAADGKNLLRIPHLGNVVLEDGVEIGSCTCIDRGTFGSTRIGAGTKIDNHCQVGHNVQFGRNTVMAGLSGVAGSCTIGDWVRIGAATGIADHRNVGSGAQLAARTALINDVPAGETWGGMPAREIKTELRHVLALQKLSPIARDLMRIVAANKSAKAQATTAKADSSADLPAERAIES